MAFFTVLPHRALITVQGEDRSAFLQGLISNDMRHVDEGRAIWAAFLTPQGKFLHDFFVVPHHESIWLTCERARRDDLVTRLARYRLRAKVTLAPDDTVVHGMAWGEGAASALGTTEHLGAVVSRGDGAFFTDPRITGAGIGWILRPEQTSTLEKAGLRQASLADYDRHRISMGLPDGSRDMEVEKALLLENGFEELHGVDFAKGCYIGQELTARTHYRALIKKRLMPVAIDGATPLPGAALMQGGEDAGELKSIAGDRALALVRLDKAREGLTAGNANVTPMRPDWLTLPS